MPERFNPFPPVSGRYGAPMGRVSDRLHLDPEHCTPAELAAAGPAYEYDPGGAYWGLPAPGEGPVWAVWVKGYGREGVAYARATSRDAAKRAALTEGAL
jgi:hypothetical protein